MRKLITLYVPFVVLFVGSGRAVAQPFEIMWYTIDGGGGVSTGGSYTLAGTIGQPDAASGLAGGPYTLDPGFWPGALAAPTCGADLNHDGILDNGDIGTFIQFFLAGNLAADMNGDGFLDNGDIGAFVQYFLAGC